jgi:hypothetical protein
MKARMHAAADPASPQARPALARRNPRITAGAVAGGFGTIGGA